MNILLHNILVLFRRFVNKVAKVMGRTIYFSNAYGIKAYAKPRFVLAEDVETQCIDINPNDIHLSFDALKDEYTHVGMKLADSPHLGLVKTIREGGEISQTTYFKEELEGRLDGRYEQPYTDALANSHLVASKRQKSDRPIVYKVENVYFVLDGKHRLATALMERQTKVQCIEIPPKAIALHCYTKDVLRLMQKQPETYRKNIKHIESLI
mgnify:CR=1 FL=1